MDALKSINRIYVQKLIDSLELDYKNWKREYYACAYGSWFEYTSPEYVNDNGETIVFCFTLNGDGAYINGYRSWTIPFYVIGLYPFSKMSRKFFKLSRRMKKYLKNIDKDIYVEHLKEAI
jgi:hypothetical protein